ncbi:MAG: hypothetical protein QOF60_2624 [Actinomycetota bacterium]|jgi:hypothetical protein|nr:hypothetical protein [Actinomycetota bacterium]
MITVTPETFELVQFDAAEIAALAADVAKAVGLADDVTIAIAIDETAIIGKASSRVEDDGRIVLDVTGGAFESLRKARTFDENRAKAVLGQALMRARDRIDPDFGNPPADDALSVPEETAWATSIEGRLDRLGILVGRPQRRIYHFRVRHGFNDTVDRIFDRLWTTDSITWAEIAASSSEAVLA